MLQVSTASGIITAATEFNSPLIGVGTDAPVCEIQVRKTGRAEIQVTSDTGIAALTIGREQVLVIQIMQSLDLVVVQEPITVLISHLI